MDLVGTVLVVSAATVAVVMLWGGAVALRETYRQSGRHGRPPGTAGKPLPPPLPIPQPGRVVSTPEWGLGVVMAASDIERRIGTFPACFGNGETHVCDVRRITFVAGRPEHYGLTSIAAARTPR